MASTEAPFEQQSSNHGGCQSLSHSISPAAENIKRPQILRVDSTRTTSHKTTLSPRGKQTSRRRPSLAADDVLPIGLLENASVAGQHLNNTLSSRTSIRRSVSCATAAQDPMAVERVQRWSGMTRTVSDWDGLRRVCIEQQLSRSLLTLPRTLNYGLKTAIAMYTSTPKERRAEALPSASPFGP
jgi:hypothetical protein